MSEEILITGLTVSLLGTVIMTIPLIPRARILFDFGKLREAKRSIRYDRLKKGDKGFQMVASRHLKERGYSDEIDVNEIEYITHEPKLSADIINTDSEDTPKYVGSSTTDLIFVRYDLNEDNEHGIGSSYHENIHEFYQLFEPDIRQGEQRTRLFGIILLAIGFGFQIISILI